MINFMKGNSRIATEREKKTLSKAQACTTPVGSGSSEWNQASAAREASPDVLSQMKMTSANFVFSAPWWG